MTPDHREINGYTLLTGSTGSIGAYLLCDLLRAQMPVAVLVRGSSKATATQRIERQLCQMEKRVGRHLLRPVILEGDLCQPELGLSPTQQSWITKHCSRVLHSAASLSFAPADQHPDNEPFRTNVQGTQHLLQLCRTANIREFHYVSTAYSCGLHSGTVTETLHSDDQNFANDYERSKAQAERELSSSVDLDSLTIYRPSIVVDPSTGASRQTDQAISKAFSTYQLLSSRFGLPEPGAWLKNLTLTGTERKNIVSAQWVARMVVQILRQTRLHGSIYHLTSEAGTTVRTLEDGFRAAVVGHANSGSHQKKSPAQSAAVDRSMLDKLAAPYVATFLPYFRDDPTFDQTNFQTTLEACRETPCPAVGVDEICAIATAQLTPPPQRTVTNNAEATKGTALWQNIRQRMNSSAKPASNNPGQQAGLMLTGPGGGQWTLCWDTQTINLQPGIHADITRRLYMSVATLERLLQQKTSVAKASSEGRLLAECDDVDSSNWATTCLQRISESLMSDSHTTTSDEVAHVR